MSVEISIGILGIIVTITITGFFVTKRIRQKAKIKGSHNIIIQAENVSIDRKRKLKELIVAEAYIHKKDTSVLIDELKEAVKKGEKVSNLLFRAMEVAKRLDRKSDVKWIEKELFGWEEKDISRIPEYRRMNGKIRISFQGRIDEWDYPYLIPRDVYELERLLEQSKRGTGYFVVSIPTQPEWVKDFPEIFDKASQVPITTNAQEFKKALDGIRKSILKFTLDI